MARGRGGSVWFGVREVGGAERMTLMETQVSSLEHFQSRIQRNFEFNVTLIGEHVHGTQKPPSSIPRHFPLKRVSDGFGR